jgi:transcriptional regulator GlxA family with amidase domain
VPERQGNAFRLYTVGPTSKTVHASSGMQIIPDYTFENAPAPKVIVIPAQNGSNPAMLDWIRRSAPTADVTMSVCTGAFVLADTRLFSGKAATTHHGAYSTVVDRKFAENLPLNGRSFQWGKCQFRNRWEYWQSRSGTRGTSGRN